MSTHVNKPVNPDGSKRGPIDATAHVADTAYVGQQAQISGNAQVSGAAQVFGHAQVSGAAWISEVRHVLTLGPIGSEHQTVTLWRTADAHGLSVGCWRDHTIDELRDEVMRRAPQCWPEYRLVRKLLRLRAAEWDLARGEGQ